MRTACLTPLAATCALTLAACGGASSDPSAQPQPVVVFAAASLNNAFSAAAPGLRQQDGVAPQYSFAGSQQLVQNIIDGAPADVIATADTTTMDRLVQAGLVDTPQIFAHNRLEIAVAPGNPKHITSLADLARSDVSVVLAASNVPAGAYALQALRMADVTVHPVSLELDVATVLEKVEDGDADAAIVYTTDVAGAGGRVQGVAIPAGDNVVATYPISVVKASTHQAAAQAFVQSVVSGLVQQALLQKGFLPP